MNGDPNEDLFAAAAHGDSHGAASALARGANPLERRSCGVDALIVAASRGVASSVAQGRGLDWLAKPWGRGPGHAQVVALLLAAGADARNASRVGIGEEWWGERREGWTALMWASDGGYWEAVELLAPVSDAWAKSSEGDTALMLASMCAGDGGAESARILAAYGGLEELDSKGRTPFVRSAMGRWGAARAIFDALGADRKRPQAQAAAAELQRIGEPGCADFLMGWLAKWESEYFARELDAFCGQGRAERSGARSL